MPISISRNTVPWEKILGNYFKVLCTKFCVLLGYLKFAVISKLFHRKKLSSSTITISNHFLKKDLFLLMDTLCICECMPHVCKYPQRQKEGAGYPGAGVQAVVRHLIWVLGTKLGTCRRAGNALNHWSYLSS